MVLANLCLFVLGNKPFTWHPMSTETQPTEQLIQIFLKLGITGLTRVTQQEQCYFSILNQSYEREIAYTEDCFSTYLD